MPIYEPSPENGGVWKLLSIRSPSVFNCGHRVTGLLYISLPYHWSSAAGLVGSAPPAGPELIPY